MSRFPDYLFLVAFLVAFGGLNLIFTNMIFRNSGRIYVHSSRVFVIGLVTAAGLGVAIGFEPMFVGLGSAFANIVCVGVSIALGCHRGDIRLVPRTGRYSRADADEFFDHPTNREFFAPKHDFLAGSIADPSSLSYRMEHEYRTRHH
ncbi:hypothetical protein Bpla01_60340 [Burkholderia plantarii]|nr:hypothetical protein Bpla01_60340 [Burkholderia plantarii]